MAPRAILMGVIGRPHGVRGHVHVHSYAARPEDLCAYGTLHDAAGRQFALAWVGRGIAAVCEVTGGQARAVADREAAERLTNTELFIDRAALPAPDEDEFYLADLIGLAAVGPDGATLGRVAAVHDYGGGASLEIGGAAGTLLLPFNRDCVKVVDPAAGRLEVVVPDEVVVPGFAAEAGR